MLFKIPGATTRRSKTNSVMPISFFLIVIGGIGLFFQVNWIRKTTVKETNNTPTMQYPCHYCQGKATVRSLNDLRRQEPCPLCFGLGRRVIRFIPGFHQPCAECIGMGHVLDTDEFAMVCTTCGGWGTQIIEEVTISSSLQEILDSEKPVPSSNQSLDRTTPYERRTPPDALPAIEEALDSETARPPEEPLPAPNPESAIEPVEQIPLKIGPK